MRFLSPYRNKGYRGCGARLRKLAPLLMGILLSGAAGASALELSLSESIERAYEHSNAIQAARLDSSSSAFRYREARAAYFPTLSLQAVSFYKDALQSIDIPPRSIELGSHENYQADVRLTVPLYTGGRISKRVRIEEQHLRSSAFDLEAERLRNAWSSRRAYLNLMTAQSIERSAEASLERVRVIEKNVLDLFAGGMADSVDILDVRLAVRDAIQMLEEKRTIRRNASSTLARLIGTPPEEPLRLTEAIPDPAPPDASGNAPAINAPDRPELRAIDGRIRAAELAVGLKTARYLPVVSGYGAYSAGKPNQDIFNNEWNDYFSGGLSFVWDFNMGGAVANGVNAAREAALSGRMTKKDLEESLVLRARIALHDVELAYAVFTLSREKVEISRNKFRLAKEKQAAGGMSVNRLLELESELAAVEEQYAASRSNYYVAETELLYAIGSKKIYGGL